MTAADRTAEARYRVIGELGRGGMGVVLRVDDSLRGEEVALKSVLRRDSGSLIRLKREFRVIADLRHPGLVRLHDLGEDEDGPFFTMELIDGIDVLSYCWGLAVAIDPTAASRSKTVISPTTTSGPFGSGPEPSAPAEPPPLDWARLAAVLPQIVEALSYLHAAGVVHRDLKPSNVMVTRDGRVKLLDFGVLALLGADGPEGILGTAGYAAPEQLDGEPVGPAADAYALGAMIFQIVSGMPVFEGTPLVVVHRTLADAPPRLDEVAPLVPRALADLVDDLLRKEPERRPSLAEVEARLSQALGARRSKLPSAPPPAATSIAAPAPRAAGLVGRDELLAELRAELARASRGEMACIALVGPSGVGKTALAEALAADASASGGLVLRGRARPHERVAFNVLDGAMDQLAAMLRRKISVREELRLAAGSAFPVLLPAGGRVPERVAPREVFDAVIALLAEVVRATGSLILIADDLQWADADSAALLARLLDATPAGVALIGTARDDAGPSDGLAADPPAVAAVAAHPRTRWVMVPPLPDEALAAIIARFSPPRLDAGELARVCAGRPFLAEVVGRALGRGVSLEGSLDHAIAALVDRAAPFAREVLALLVAAEEWTALDELAAITRRTRGAIEDAVRDLELDGLVRREGASGSRADVYHDAVARAAAQVLGEGTIAGAHGRLADHLHALGAPVDARRVRHLAGAGRDAEAREAAPAAARLAESRGAFGLAAELYATALLGAGEDAGRADLLRARAVALEHGARYREAVTAWAELGRLLEREAAPSDTIVDVALHEAYALLASNELVLGRSRLHRALALAGERPLAEGALTRAQTALRFWLEPRRWLGPLSRALRAPTRLDPDRAPTPDRDIRVGQLLGYLDPAIGVGYLLRAREGFARAGADEQAVWCDYVFAYFALWQARRRGRVALAERYRARATERLAGRAPASIEVRCFPQLLDAIEDAREGRFDAARPRLESVAAATERAGIRGTFEHLIVCRHLVHVDLCAQDLPRLEASLRRFREAVRDSGDNALRCHVDFCEIYRLTYRGEIDEALALHHRVAREWPDGVRTIQRFFADVWTAVPAVYRPHALAEVRGRVQMAHRRDRALFPLAHMYAGAAAAASSLVEAAALRAGDPDASALRVARWARHAIGAPPFRPGAPLRALAYAADHAGRPEVALVLLERAARAAARLGQQIDVAIACDQRGRRLRGRTGTELREEARRRILAAGSTEALLDEDPGAPG